MLQQMSSPHVGEAAALVRPLEGRVCGDPSSEASLDTVEEFELPECKIKRNYNCVKCIFYTQNPRAFLVHLRDIHLQKVKIYDCPYCVYASRHHQKLVRHLTMVHGGAGVTSTATSTTTTLSQSTPAMPFVPVALAIATSPKAPSDPEPDVSMLTTENIEPAPMEDLLEEVEETDDTQIDVEDCNDDIMEQIIEVDDDEERNTTTVTTSDPKGKGKIFSCTKCNYATHIKARFTKHVKYHSMPMIKCTVCDFRTPYKWNLDRHMKNHGGTGHFHCSMCNFTADIRQSLTVHEMNHHASAAGQSGVSRRRNRVGASDMSLEAASALVVKEEEGSGDSRSSHSETGMQYVDIEMVSCNSESNDTSVSDGEKKDRLLGDADSQNTTISMSDERKLQKQGRKPPRPIPQLIPLNASTPNQAKPSTGEPPCKKFKETSSSGTTSPTSSTKLSSDITAAPATTTSANIKETSGRKKNESFFDKLKERLLTETGEEGSLICKNCGFESKCLSEHSVHEKTCTVQSSRIVMNAPISNLGSTRCQNCRHRCKSSADLYVHMQTCGKTEVIDDHSVTTLNTEDNEQPTTSQDRDSVPHPMENVVFVWNSINQDSNKFGTPLDININDDSTLPEPQRHFELDIADDNDGMNLSPSQAVGKKVFKCPHCQFWASTASRFHVHIVGHLNKKPFECSLCKYKSNWRWDITKHIKLKSARDPEHNEAKVLMTDETGRRNYSKYNKFLAMPIMNEKGENEFHYIDQNASIDATMEMDDTFSDINDGVNLTIESVQPLNLQTQLAEQNRYCTDGTLDLKKPKKTLWKCKKCNYKDPSKLALLEHVREHARVADDEVASLSKKPDAPDPADLAFRCGHCNQLSNWKHVIQRHCRLKHDGVIKVITTVRPKPEETMFSEITNDACNKCPFRTSDSKAMMQHVQYHQPSPQAVFKCYFCPYFVKTDQELAVHMKVHGVTEPEEYINKSIECKSPLPEPALAAPASGSTSTKRHRCTECPYETNSKSQYMYHEQFHRLPADTPYKCPQCNYSVSKRHLLHQHLRVHGIFPKKTEMEAELEAAASSHERLDSRVESYSNLDEIPYVWVSAKNEFHKMYKCRYCSYVNSQKCKIPNHEKIHCLVFEKSDITIYKCLECKFTCDNAGRLAHHSKTHGEIYGRIYCPVETDIADEEQIAKLRKVIEIEKLNASEDFLNQDGILKDEEVKILYFCQKCPARFFDENELMNHVDGHSQNFEFKCLSCVFSTEDENDLNIHAIVHSDDYRTKTKMLKFKHNSHPANLEPSLDLIHCPNTSEITWIVNPCQKRDSDFIIKKPNEKHTPKQYSCKECPAKFFKSSALSYHVGLHGGEGEHKCKKCSYSVKNVGNLAKHELLHDTDGKTSNDYDSGDDMDFKNIPLSGTDLFQRKTEAQKRVVTDKDKLVKPNDHFPPVLQADPQFGYLMHGNPEFIYPTYLKNGRQKEKRYKCHKCPSAFEKREQYKIHLSLHGSKQRYKCEICDYSVKYYANYVQHMRKHQMNDEAQAERKKGSDGLVESETFNNKQEDSPDNIKLAIKTMPKGIPKTDFQQFSISDQQTLRLLQRRRSINNNAADTSLNENSSAKDRKQHSCLLCPYTNQRQDSLNNHYRRHEEQEPVNPTHKCSYCDLVVVQSHFLRDHLKSHFVNQKTLTPECFVANKDVVFTITKIDEDVTTDLKIDIHRKSLVCNDKKIFANMKTGELIGNC